MPSHPNQYVEARRPASGSNLHSITIHALAHENVVVVVVGADLLDSGRSTTLELGNLLCAGFLLLETLEDLLDVAWKGGR